MVGFVAAFAFGIWAVSRADPNPSWMLGWTGLFSLTLFCLLTNRQRRQSAGLQTALVLFLWCLAGMARVGMIQQSAVADIRNYAGQRATVHGTIAATPQTAPGAPGEWLVTYVVKLDHLIGGSAGSRLQPLSGGLRLSLRQKQPVPAGGEGDSITAAGTVRLFSAYHNPGQPDWETLLAIRGLDARMSAQPAAVRIVRQNDPHPAPDRLDHWRKQARAALLMAMPDQDAALIMGMLFGGYDGIDRQTAADFAATGIVHILSVSGAHIALVAGAVFWLTRRLSVPESGSALTAGIAMLGYGLISGFSAPVVRSILMGLITVGAIGLKRPAASRRALWVAVLSMLIYEPRNLLDLSFQLSVGCTAGLLYLQPTLAAWLENTGAGWLSRGMAAGFAATLSAQLAVIPLLAWYFGTLPLISLAANLLVVPLLEAVILLGLAGLLLAGWVEALARPVFVGISLLTGLAVEINRFLARLPGGSIPLPAMGGVGSCLYYGVLVWSCGWVRTGGYSAGMFGAWLRRNFRQAAAVGMISVGAAVFVWLRPGPLQVHFIDVGQGDATLLITPHGRSILVDAGGTTGTSAAFDVGERVVVPYLRHYGVNAVDWLILTHNHQDHAGGAAAVAERFRVGRVLLHRDETAESPAILRLRQTMRGRGLQSAADVAELHVDGVKVILYQAGGDQPDGTGKNKSGKSGLENGRSTVVRIEFGRHSFLLTGDLEGESETRIVKSAMRPSTVLKVGHHGGRRATGLEFLAKVAPQYAVISVGADNRYGHPAAETLERLREWPAGIFRTDRDGAVVFRSDGDRLTVERSIR